MEKDVLVILMVAFGLFAIVMFVLFFVYLKKYYNSRHINEDYIKDEDNSHDESNLSDDTIWEVKKEPVSLEKEQPSFKEVETYDLDDFVPIKKK